jgi:hypothetical protein
MPDYKYYPDPIDLGKVSHWRFDGNNWAWTKQPYTNDITSSKLSDKDWTVIDSTKVPKSVTDLLQPTINTQIIPPVVNPIEPVKKENLFDVGPIYTGRNNMYPFISPTGKYGQSPNPSPMWGATGNYTPTPPKEKSLEDRLFESSLKSIEEQKKYNKIKGITDTLLTSGAMLGEMTAGRPEPVRAPLFVPPTYRSVLPEYKNQIDRSMAAVMAAGTKVAQETGRPELIPAQLANVMASQNTAYSNLAAQDISQQNLQASANAEALNKNEENRYLSKIADNEMMDKINIARSEMMAKMGTSLFSNIPNTYMGNKSLLTDMEDKTMLYKHLIGKGEKISFEDFLSMYDRLQGKQSYNVNNTNISEEEEK